MSTSWGDFDDADIVVHTRVDLAIAVYTNAAGEVVVRQQADWPHEDEDHVVLFAREHVQAIARAILAEAGIVDAPNPRQIAGTGEPTPAKLCPGSEPIAPAPRDRTGAERQRRWRERNGSGRNGITDRNGAVGSNAAALDLKFGD